MGYQRIENYGLIGNMHTTALVGRHGAIDWYCFPHFDSPSVFAAILDDEKGGTFRIAPVPDGVTYKQLYLPDTNVLVTRFLSPDGVGQIEDFMPAAGENRHRLIRRVRVSRGKLRFRVVCEPAFDYARATHETEIGSQGAIFTSQTLRLILHTDVQLERSERGAVAEFELEQGESHVFVLQELAQGAAPGPCPTCDDMEKEFVDTIHFWRNWLSSCSYTGRWREMVERSALVLKLLTFEPTGAIVAAPTCSLPESMGGIRNWDYRFTWIRDAAFTVYGFIRIGFTREAAGFMTWLASLTKRESPNGPMQIVYSINGDSDLTEIELDHLDGYRGSKPVRIGNGAYDQFQLDIYGELLDAIYLYNKHGTPIGYDTWLYLRSILNWLCDNWRRPDSGIWETRSGPQQFVYSKLMCWVAMDRGLRLAEKRSFPAERERWLAVRDEIYEEIMKKGWSDSRQAFVQHFGSEELDASNLIMPLVFFLSPSDPRLLKTLQAVNRSPRDGGLVSDGLVYRYDTSTGSDGLHGAEGTFNMCSFWLVEALTRAGTSDPKLLDEARLLFERMLGYANHVGLFAEETGPTGEALGNFPQAFTHLALISAAFNLDRALSGK